MSDKTRNIRLEGVFALKSPLSHIGENIGNSSHLVEEVILQPDGSAERVFSYGGNAWRGQLRDLIATYMLDHLGSPRLGIDAFHMLFSGGRIGGPQVTDIGEARRLRSVLTPISLLGGGVGNQILSGKLRVGNAYPVCRQAIPVLPEDLREAACQIDYADCTFAKEHSRRDDAKIENLRRHLDPIDDPYAAAIELIEGGKVRKKRTPKDDGGAADQMRIRMELVSPGVMLHTWISAHDVTDAEIGCLVSGLREFAKGPHIGGQASRGYGRVDLVYSVTDLDAGETYEFVSITDGKLAMSHLASQALEAYDVHLDSMREAMSLAASPISMFLAGPSAKKSITKDATA